jgi:hypothetical protein
VKAALAFASRAWPERRPRRPLPASVGLRPSKPAGGTRRSGAARFRRSPASSGRGPLAVSLPLSPLEQPETHGGLRRSTADSASGRWPTAAMDTAVRSADMRIVDSPACGVPRPNCPIGVSHGRRCEARTGVDTSVDVHAPSVYATWSRVVVVQTDSCNPSGMTFASFRIPSHNATHSRFARALRGVARHYALSVVLNFGSAVPDVVVANEPSDSRRKQCVLRGASAPPAFARVRSARCHCRSVSRLRQSVRARRTDTERVQRGGNCHFSLGHRHLRSDNFAPERCGTCHHPHTGHDSPLPCNLSVVAGRSSCSPIFPACAGAVSD